MFFFYIDVVVLFSRDHFHILFRFSNFVKLIFSSCCLKLLVFITLTFLKIKQLKSKEVFCFNSRLWLPSSPNTLNQVFRSYSSTLFKAAESSGSRWIKWQKKISLRIWHWFWCLSSNPLWLTKLSTSKQVFWKTRSQTLRQVSWSGLYALNQVWRVRKLS